MLISQLVKNLDCSIYGEDIAITGLNYDSRKIKDGELFFAIRGFKLDGHDYIEEAVKSGAIAVVVEEAQVLEDRVTQIVVKDTREAMGIMAATYYNNPAGKLRVIGITGTNGKTTTSYLIKAILEQAGYQVGLIGSIQNMIGSKSVASQRTTPESLDLQYLLSLMVEADLDYVVMEVSSHALELNRTAGLEYDLALFTNFTQDHLDFHQDFEHYFAAKVKLFSELGNLKKKQNKVAVINFDDPYGCEFAAQSRAPIYSYGIKQLSQVQAENVQLGEKGVNFDLHTPLGKVNLDLKLAGIFNVYNAMAASSICLVEGISLKDIKKGLENVNGVAGRFELVDGGQDFTVIVDYAHTPDSLVNILKTARALTPKRIILVFGAGGDRDRTKRPLMGEVAAKYSDLVVLTSDNPRSENPELICGEIEQGLLREAKSKAEFEYKIEVDRARAINQAIRLARSGDVVIIAGKGHETYQEFANGIVNFDDRAVALGVLKEL